MAKDGKQKQWKLYNWASKITAILRQLLGKRQILRRLFKKAETIFADKVCLSQAMFPLVCMDMSWTKETVPENCALNCEHWEDSWRSLGLWKIQPVNQRKSVCIFMGRLMLSWNSSAPAAKIWRADTMERHWCWEKIEGEMVGWHHQPMDLSLMLWECKWTGKPGVPMSMGMQVRRDWRLNWMEQTLWSNCTFNR